MGPLSLRPKIRKRLETGKKMYFFERHTEFRCVMVKVAPFIEKGFDYDTLERTILKTFIKTGFKLNYIFDLTRIKKFTETESAQLTRLANYFPLKAPEAILLIGETEVTKFLEEKFLSLSQKEGTVLITAENFIEAEKTTKEVSNLKLTNEYLKGLLYSENDQKEEKNRIFSIVDDDSRDFFPKKRIEIQFFNGAGKRFIKEVTVLQFNQEKKLLLTSQTSPPIDNNTKRNVKITTLSTKNTGSLVRIEYKCRIQKIIKNIKIRNTVIKDALLIQCTSPRKEINYRNSYRYRIKSNYKVESIITFSGKKFFSNMHFDIDDISITGVGLKVPKDENGNTGFKAKIGDNAKIEATLIEPDKYNNRVKKTKIESFIEVVRRAPLNGNEELVGVRFRDINKNYEMYINRFISNAQSYELRKKHRNI